MGKIISLFLGLIMCIILFNVLFKEAIKDFKVNYQKPDTTITVKNGKYDTAIVIRKLPFWLK